MAGGTTKGLAFAAIAVLLVVQFESFAPPMLPSSSAISTMQSINHDAQDANSATTTTTTTMEPLPVVVFPFLVVDQNNATGSEMSQIILDGLAESPLLYMAADTLDIMASADSVVWLADTKSGHYKKWCQVLIKWVQRAKQVRIDYKNSTSNVVGNVPTQWPLYILDYGDTPGQRTRCGGIEEELGSEQVHYIKRSIVAGRHFNGTRQWVDEGRVVTQHKNGATYRYASYAVRTDIVQALQEALQQRNLALHDAIETAVPRNLDLVHLWTKGNGKVVAFKSALRTLVNGIVAQAGQKYNLTTFVGIRGRAKEAGRRRVESEYIDTLLDAKILVVTQRDAWIDHYRLFEAMVGGCMVMTDALLVKPPGIVNGTHLVEFSSAAELEGLALYYLQHDDERIAIARQGRDMAMRQHRTWHRVEEIIFGEARTNCSLPGSPRHCPYTVHAVGDE